MCAPIAAALPYIVAGAAVASTAATVYNGQKAVKEQEKAMQQAQANSDKQLEAVQEQVKKTAQTATPTPQKQPTVAAMFNTNKQQGSSAVASTSLTGPQGVDPSKLLLGKNTLLGM